jgi:hypothetical protein
VVLIAAAIATMGITLVSVALMLRTMESEKRLVEAYEDCLIFLTSSECNDQIPGGSELYDKHR